MPIINKAPLQKAKLPENLHPDERVFYIHQTGEVFRDYRAFFDRMILYNTTAWTCCFSGKSGFTLGGVMDCENQYRQELDLFPEAVKVPVLYLITLMKRRNINDLVDELTSFMKERFFIQEEVNYTSENNERFIF